MTWTPTIQNCDNYDTPMLFQCEAQESGGVQCEVLISYPQEPHAHWISDETIARKLYRPFYIHIGL